MRQIRRNFLSIIYLNLLDTCLIGWNNSKPLKIPSGLKFELSSENLKEVDGIKTLGTLVFFFLSLSLLSLPSPFHFSFRWILGLLGIFRRNNSCRAMLQMPKNYLFSPESGHSRHFLVISSISCRKIWLDLEKDTRRNLAYFHYFDVFLLFSRSYPK